MEKLFLPGTRSTPEISFDGTIGVLTISGESYPENSFEYYKPILAWVSRFAQTHTGPATLNINLNYLNTGSIKSLMDILDYFEEMHGRGGDVVIYWHYDDENDRALETAEDFKAEVTFPFNIIAIKSEAK